MPLDPTRDRVVRDGLASFADTRYVERQVPLQNHGRFLSPASARVMLAGTIAGNPRRVVGKALNGIATRSAPKNRQVLPIDRRGRTSRHGKAHSRDEAKK